MKSFTNSRKFLFGVSVSMVLAMAIGSFALSETQTTTSPQEVETQSLVGATAGAFTVNGGTQGTDYEFTGTSGTDGVLTIHPQSIETNITISNTGTTTDRIEVTSAATITLAGVNIDRSSITTTTEPAALTITDNANFDVKILLVDNTTNILKGADGDGVYNVGSPGIQKNGEGDNIGTLTIGVPDGSTGTGTLESTGGRHAAGIGGGDAASASNITINGGKVTAIGGSNGAGIGSGYGGYTTVSVSASNITISGGEVTATGGYYGAGIGGGRDGDGSDITITGGKVTAIGGIQAASIGGGSVKNGSNITISGGEVTATGGKYATGIGGGWKGSGSNITITGGEVTATGGDGAAGIGGGDSGTGSDITITGGVVTAYGGQSAAGIGGGKNGSGSGNSLNGDAVVSATSGDAATKPALEGFEDAQQESLLTQGIAFTGLGTAFDSDGHATAFSWDESGTMYGSVTLYKDLELLANLTVPSGNTLTINQGATLKIPTGKTLKNDGTITINNTGTINCQGTITTKTNFYLDDGSLYNTGYQIYQTSAGVQKYNNLPNPYQDPSNGKRLINWYYRNQAGQEVAISESVNVLLNEHSFYENSVYTVTVAELENGSITTDVTEAAKDDTVTFTATPDEGYRIVGFPVVETEDGTEITVTAGEDGEYTFTMPEAAVEISAIFEGIPYTVTFDSKGGSEVTSQTVVYDNTVSEPDEPTRDGYSFVEWCKDKECTTAWDFENDKVQGDMTLYAKWLGNEHNVIIPTNPDDHGTVTTDPENPKTGDEVIITVTPEEGYEIDGLPIVKTEDGRIIEVIPTGNPNEYKFIMPDSDVTIEVNFVLISEPTVEPEVKTGDSFTGIAALAILGLATTGAVLVRKRK